MVTAIADHQKANGTRNETRQSRPRLSRKLSARVLPDHALMREPLIRVDSVALSGCSSPIEKSFPLPPFGSRDSISPLTPFGHRSDSDTIRTPLSDVISPFKLNSSCTPGTLSCCPSHSRSYFSAARDRPLSTCSKKIDASLPPTRHEQRPALCTSRSFPPTLAPSSRLPEPKFGPLRSNSVLPDLHPSLRNLPATGSGNSAHVSPNRRFLHRRASAPVLGLSDPLPTIPEDSLVEWERDACSSPPGRDPIDFCNIRFRVA